MMDGDKTIWGFLKRRKHMFSEPPYCFISEKERWLFLAPILQIISKGEVAIFDLNLTFFSGKRIKLKCPEENMCSRHFQGVF